MSTPSFDITDPNYADALREGTVLTLLLSPDDRVEITYFAWEGDLFRTYELRHGDQIGNITPNRKLTTFIQEREALLARGWSEVITLQPSLI